MFLGRIQIFLKAAKMTQPHFPNELFTVLRLPPVCFALYVFI